MFNLIIHFAATIKMKTHTQSKKYTVCPKSINAYYIYSKISNCQLFIELARKGEGAVVCVSPGGRNELG